MIFIQSPKPVQMKGRIFLLATAMIFAASVSYAESNSPPASHEPITIDKAVKYVPVTVAVAFEQVNIVAPVINPESTPAVENSTAFVAQRTTKTLNGHPVVRFVQLRFSQRNVNIKPYKTGSHDYSLLGYNKKYSW
jgi:hypothetical protein